MCSNPPRIPAWPCTTAAACMGCDALLAPRNCCLHTLHWRNQNMELGLINRESREVIWFSTSLWSNDEVGYKDAQTNPVQFMSPGLLLHLLNFHLSADFWWLDLFLAISTCQFWRKSAFQPAKGGQKDNPSGTAVQPVAWKWKASCIYSHMLSGRKHLENKGPTNISSQWQKFQKINKGCHRK